MRQNQKKLISLLLLLAMLFTILPAAAFAGTEADSNSILLMAEDNAITITATTGSQVQLFRQVKNYSCIEYATTSAIQNEDGTTTFTFKPENKTNLSYRVSKEGYITKAGYLDSDTQNITVTYDEQDLKSSNSESNVPVYMENSLLLNVNGQNHLQMQKNETFRLRAYRTWQIVNNTISNVIIEPDFHFKILSGEDVIQITSVISGNGNASGNWMDIKALKEGIAVVEIYYDAIKIDDKDLYNATDSSRTGLIVVQVGDNVSTDVDFGIASYSSSGSDKIAESWDSEFDTLYFLENYGILELVPTANESIISEIAVSNDKGENWDVLSEIDGAYTAKIISGNNIIRIKKQDGTVSYQIVRGAQLTATIVNQTEKGKKFEVGDTARITLNGLHMPVMKMAGIYNPCSDSDGWGNPAWATSAAKISYLFQNESVVSVKGTQYGLITENNYLDIILNDVTKNNYILTKGCIAGDLYGAELTDLNNHRGLDDAGTGVNMSADTVHYTRSILPDLKISLGDQEIIQNTAPVVADPCFSIPSIFKGESYNVSLSNLFYDADHDILTYQVSVNGGEAIAIDGEMYLFQPTTAGEHTLIFMASDGQESVSYETTVTVKTPSSGGSGSGSTDNNFDMNGKEIAGYVTMSFEDNAKRPVGSKVANSLGTIIGATEVPYANGESVAAVTLRLLDAKGIQANYNGSTSNGFYLAAIQNFKVNGEYYSSLGEFDAGSGSGWMYSVNGEFPQVDASSYDAESGAVICWKYTSALGEDVGSSTGGGSASGSTAAAAAQAATGKEVAALIEKIGTVQKDSGELLAAIRAAYDKLSDAEKKLVENYDALLAAEQQYSRLTSPLPFQDVSETHWAHDAIQYLYSQSLMGGTGDAAFSPEASLSRGMLVTILYRLEGEPKAIGNNDFADVTDRAWYSNAVLWASANGIVSGYGGGQFGPDDAITREQLAAMLMRYAQYKQYDTSKASSLTGYADAAEISSWAESALAWANAEGLITGRSSTALAPRETVTRAETAAILMRYLQKIVIEPVK